VYKNLIPEILGISGRQSEIIELALTYGFRGIDVDMLDLVKRCQRSSFESAARFLLSSKLKIGGFQAPIDLDADDEAYSVKLAALNGVAEIAARVDARIALLSIPAGTNRLPYPEYFEVVRKRIDEIAAVFGKESIQVGLSFQAVPNLTEEKQFKFIRDVDGFLVLVKACSAKNLGIVFDSWNWFIGGGTMSQFDALGPQKVVAVRLADCSEGVDRAAATHDDCLLPGTTGVIDNLAFLQKFADAKLKLPVAAMGRPANSTATRDTTVSLAQDALDKVFQEAGIPCQTRKPDMFVEQSYVRS
jgi:sugar phosphate isomerase/epimerase